MNIKKLNIALTEMKKSLGDAKGFDSPERYQKDAATLAGITTKVLMKLKPMIEKGDLKRAKEFIAHSQKQLDTVSELIKRVEGVSK